jgi:hypothetical protein
VVRTQKNQDRVFTLSIIYILRHYIYIYSFSPRDTNRNPLYNMFVSRTFANDF